MDPLSWPTPSGSELTRFRSAVQANLDPGPRSCGVDKLSRPTRCGLETAAGSTNTYGLFGPRSEELWGPRAIPTDSVPGPS